jgi:probable phosphomutase (TIGR03848 family)
VAVERVVDDHEGEATPDTLATMATVILLRHGRTTANASGVLAGRSRGVRLDEVGRPQAERAAARLAAVRLARIVSSPLERCRQTAAVVAAAQSTPLDVVTERGLTECDYGEWTGRAIKDLAKEKVWGTVQRQPSAAVFPGGEALAAMSARVSATVRRLDAQIEAEHGPGAVWVASSHGDPIKAVIADALGLHLDQFQRIVVDPASISVVRYTDSRPFVLSTNTHEGDLSWLTPPQRSRRRRTTDAVVGGGAGPE